MKKMIRIKAEEIARLRVLRGLRSEAALARKAGLARQHVNRVLRLERSDGVTLGTVNALCNALECDLVEILEHTPDRA